MAWEMLAWRGLVHAGLGSLVLFGIASLALAWRRQPAQRLRLIELALAASLAAPGLSLVPGMPSWSIGWLDFSAAPAGDSAAPAGDSAAPAGDSAAPAGDRPAAKASFADASGAAPSRANSGRPLAAQERRAPLANTAGPPKNAAWRPRWNDVSLARAVLAIYAVAAIALFLRWLKGVVNLLRLKRAARPAPAAAAEMFAAIAGPEGRRVALLVSPRIDAPITFGWRRPVILLPESLCTSADQPALRYCLAHEWDHVERGDARVWYLAAAVQFAFFYQPLFWRLRRQLRLCQDYLADARAAGQAAMVEDYAEYLLAVARRRLTVSPLPAMGFGDRRSHLYRRVMMLVERREPLERRCRRRWNAAFTLAAAGLALGASTLRLDAGATRGDAARGEVARQGLSLDSASGAAGPASPALGGDRPAAFEFDGRITDHDTGQPIEGAVVIVRRRELAAGENRILQESRHQTDSQGVYSFAITTQQAAKRRLYLEFDVEHPEYAAKSGVGGALDALRARAAESARPFFTQIALHRGEEVTGAVEWFDGLPAAGLEVLAYSQADGAAWDYAAFSRAKTDSAGRFRVKLASSGNGIVYLLPAGRAPAMHVVRHKRGDLGRIRLPAGIVGGDRRPAPQALVAD
jgi:beta-lactamase regulating signal transducer with metallopeptidase domain